MKKTYLIIAAVLLAFLCGIFLIRYRLYTSVEQTRQTRIAVILNGDREDKSYAQTYYDAMRGYEAAHEEAEVAYHDMVATDAFLPLVERLVAEGYWIFVCNSYEYEPYIPELTKRYPDIYFINGSGTGSGTRYCGFLGRAYQARYLAGIVAGKRTATGEIGYVIGMPIPETIRQVNAFTLGVKKVNPEATVYVRFVNDWNDDALAREAARKLMDRHSIDVMSLHVNSIAPLQVASERGAYVIGNNYDNRELFPDTYLTATVFHWQDFLEERISECERGKLRGMHHWESIRSGSVSLAPLTGNVFFLTGDEVERERKKILEGTFDVFYGPVYDNSGVLRVREDENLPDEELLYRMYWYVDGVVTE